MAEGQWLEVQHEGGPLFLVGPSARSYWAAAHAQDVLVSVGSGGGAQLLGQYLIARQLGSSAQVDLRDDAAITKALCRAGLTPQDAAAFLELIDGPAGSVDLGEFLSGMLKFQEKLTKPPSKGFLLQLALGRHAAKQLPADGVEYNALPSDVKEEHREAAASKYIRELGVMYSKLRHRLETLEAMGVQDPALNEATRAYLYGFTRSAVLVSAAAVEGALVRHPKLLSSGKSDDGLWALLARAEAHALLSEEEWRAADWLRRLRNRVAHDGYEPSQDEGADALVQCRRLMARLDHGRAGK